MKRSNGAVKTTFDLQVDWKAWAWEAKDDMEAADREGLQRVELSDIDALDRHTWRSCVRSAIRAASQLPGRGPTDVDVAPVPAR